MDKSSNDVWRKFDNFRGFELRAHRFRPEMRPVYFQYLGITPECRVLDAGCGTGVFTRYLAEGLNGGSILGFDINEGAVASGNAKLREMGLGGKARLEVADGFNLPSPTGSFDAVTNYTYLGVLSDPMAGLNEMIRVCRAGGTVSCAVATKQIQPAHWQGDYDAFDSARLQQLCEREGYIHAKYVPAPPELKQTSPWHAMRTPKLLDACGLENVRVYPMAHLITYCDGQYPIEYRRALVDEDMEDDMRGYASRFEANRDIYAAHGFSQDDHLDMIALLNEKRRYLMENLETDRSFEWTGSLNFITAGVKPGV